MNYNTQNYRDIAIAAIQQKGSAWTLASPETQKDPEIVLLALKNDPTLLPWRIDTSLFTKELLLEINREFPIPYDVFLIANPDLMNDSEFVLTIAKTNPAICEFVGSTLKKNPAFSFALLEQVGFRVWYHYLSGYVIALDIDLPISKPLPIIAEMPTAILLRDLLRKDMHSTYLFSPIVFAVAIIKLTFIFLLNKLRGVFLRIFS